MAIYRCITTNTVAWYALMGDEITDIADREQLNVLSGG